MKKILLAALFATIAGALAFGAAASLGVTSNDLGSNTQVVAACDQNGVTVAYDLNAGDSTLVDGVTVSGIDATACDGQEVYATVNASGAALTNGSGSATFSGEFGNTSVSITFGASQSANAIDGVSITITGAQPPA